MRVSLIASPYDLGRYNDGMGAGPIRYLETGADETLRESGLDVEIEILEREGPFRDELDATADVNSQLARRVRDAIAGDSFPIVLGGNCDSGLGALAGLSPGAGIVWFDAHGDFATPETSPDGYLGSMALATATGNCHAELRSRLGDGSLPVPESQVVMVGVRDVEPQQKPLLEASEVCVVPARVHGEELTTRLETALDDLRERAGKVYLHLDIDSLEPSEAPGVDFPASGGLRFEDVEDAICMISGRFEVAAASLTAFNPDQDRDDRTAHLGIRLMKTIALAVRDEREG